MAWLLSVEDSVNQICVKHNSKYEVSFDSFIEEEEEEYYSSIKVSLILFLES